MSLLHLSFRVLVFNSLNGCFPCVHAAVVQKIELFRETGRVFRKNEELFVENSWVQVMMGQGITPRAYHPVADLMGDAELQQFLENIRQQVERHLKAGDWPRTLPRAKRPPPTFTPRVLTFDCSRKS